jgi:hypothetical protein
LPGKAARPTLTFTMNEHDGVEFFQHTWQPKDITSQILMQERFHFMHRVF